MSDLCNTWRITETGRGPVRSDRSTTRHRRVPRRLPWRRRRTALRPVLLALLLGAAAVLPGAAAALKVEVEVKGVEGAHEKNVLALLGVYQERRDETLTVARLRALYRRAPEQIREALAPFGLYRVEVESNLTEPEKPGGPWSASFRIDPGPAVEIGHIDYRITGPGADNPVFPKRFPMEAGDALVHADYERAKNRILTAASDDGYIAAELVRHRVLIDPVAYEAIVEFHLDTGPQFYFGAVEFDQDLLSDRFLRRFIGFEPGDLYDSDRLLELQGRLLASDYYQNVEIVPQTDRAGPDHRVPIEVVAQRSKANKYAVGIGFSTDVGPRLSLDYRRRYIGRQGHNLRSEIEVSAVLQKAAVEYRIPIRDPVRDSLVIRGEYSGFDTDSREGDLYKLSAAQSVLTPGGWRRNIALDYRFEDSSVASSGNETFNGLVPNISWSKVEADDPINTRNGFRLKYIVQGTAEDLLSQSSWLSGSLNYKLIKSLGEDYRFIGRTDLGAIWASDLDDVPASQRFFAGGDNSIRGWGFEALGPNDPVTNETVGGRYLAVGSLELERRLFGNWSGAVFTDFGNAFDPSFEQEWEQSAGLGIRYSTPIGPVRVDVAYAITKDPEGFRLQFGIGPDL